MIEIDGKAYPLESGKQYLIAVDLHRISRSVFTALVPTLKEKFGVSAIVIGVQGDPAAVVHVIGPIAPDAARYVWACGCGEMNGVNLIECGLCHRPRGAQA